jgi:hypothetical protein
MQIANTLARPKIKPEAGGRAPALETESATVVALSLLPTRRCRACLKEGSTPTLTEAINFAGWLP